MTLTLQVLSLSPGRFSTLYVYRCYRSANPGEPESPQSLRPAEALALHGMSEKGKVAGGISFRDIAPQRLSLRHAHLNI